MQRTPYTAKAAATAAELKMIAPGLPPAARALVYRLYEEIECADLARRERQDMENYGEMTRQWREDRTKFERRRAQNDGPQAA